MKKTIFKTTFSWAKRLWDVLRRTAKAAPGYMMDATKALIPIGIIGLAIWRVFFAATPSAAIDWAWSFVILCCGVLFLVLAVVVLDHVIARLKR
ncbi:MAG: hypothetical protein JRI80_00160 [Deltaproteobacteria bacterium]|nr:hypothetical protein [Deltaproteobacteria bacterium]